MKRIIVDYKKLTSEILSLLVEKFPDGYEQKDIISFRNSKNEVIEAVEVRTDDTIYLVKIGMRVVKAMKEESKSHNEDDDDNNNNEDDGDNDNDSDINFDTVADDYNDD
ncbi:MAG: hypothetical protein KDD04_05500 [Sinomicrobium sp.]|nr:hypothetical protein [Sinomicrobium sp.]